MKKKIEFLGKKVPILAILVVLMITAASAALFMHYATLDGEIEVPNIVYVSDSYGTIIDIDGEGDLNFSSPATFEIHNDGTIPVIVDLVTSFEQDGNPVGNTEGLYADYTIIPGSTDIIENGSAIVPPGGVMVDVIFTHHPFAVPGDYDIIVEVNPELTQTIDYHDYMEYVTLTHKNGSWDPVGENSTLAYVAMGNEFYYELEAVGLTASTSHSLIYYADEVYEAGDVLNGYDIGDDKWGGTNGDAGIVIDTFTTETDGTISVSGHSELGMDIPSMPDENYDEGGKVWVVLTSDLSSGNLMPMLKWHGSEYLYEYSEIQDDDYSDLVQYTDTNL